MRLRALCRPHARRAPALPFAALGVIDDALPIVYTVRTAHQAGTWPDDDGGIRRMFDLLKLGLRSAAEVLDVESAWDERLTSDLLARARGRYTSLILGSHHVVGTEVDMDEAVRLYRQCRMDNRAHGAKVVLSINSNDNDEDQLAYRASIAASRMDEPEMPNIGLVLGEIGSYSRILNPRFTPVTHECLPVKAAPGQLAAAEIMADGVITGMIPTQLMPYSGTTSRTASAPCRVARSRPLSCPTPTLAPTSRQSRNSSRVRYGTMTTSGVFRDRAAQAKHHPARGRIDGCGERDRER